MFEHTLENDWLNKWSCSMQLLRADNAAYMILSSSAGYFFYGDSFEFQKLFTVGEHGE